MGVVTITAVLFLAMSLFAYHIYFSRTDSEPQGAATDAPGKNRLIQSSKLIHRSVNKSAGTEESEFTVGSIINVYGSRVLAVRNNGFVDPGYSSGIDPAC